MSETAFPGAAELTKECEAYLDAFTGNPVYYPVIMMLFLSNVQRYAIPVNASGEASVPSAIGRKIRLCGWETHPLT